MPVLIAFTNNCTIALQAARIVEGLCCRMMQSLWMCKWDRLIKKSMTSGRSRMSKQDSLLPSDWMFHQTGTETIAPDDVYSMQTTAPVSIATDVERNSESYSIHLIDLDFQVNIKIRKRCYLFWSFHHTFPLRNVINDF